MANSKANHKQELISYEKALNKLLDSHNIKPKIITMDIGNAMGHILADDINSPIDLPPFDNSAMDGIAYIYDQAFNEQNTERKLSLQSQTYAGDEGKILEDNNAIQIMTGAVMPKNADSVTKVEDLTFHTNEKDQNPNAVSIANPDQTKGSNIRKQGSDIAKGTLAIAKHTILNENHITFLASLGIANINVIQPLKVSYLTTGDEILKPGMALSAGKIYDSNSTYIKLFLSQNHADTMELSSALDNLEETKAHIKQALETKAQIILTCGGVSAGQKDYIPQAVKEIGGKVIFHKAKIRPGKPIYTATIGEQIFIGLAGNPISTAMGLGFFVRPLIRNILGLKQLNSTKAILQNDYIKNHKLTMFTKANVSINDQGKQVVTVLDGQESYRIKPFSLANSWVVFGESQQENRIGDLVNVFPL